MIYSIIKPFQKMIRASTGIKMGFLLLLLPILFLIDILLGSIAIPFEDFWALIQGENIPKAHELIIMEARLPKALTALLCGAAISVAGLMMQTLFRNPLAGPYILGISSGAGLGVAILVMGAGLFGFSISMAWGIPMAAMLGAFGILLVLFLISLKVQDIMTVLIFGIMLGAVATAIIGLIQYFSSDAQLKSFLIWTLGSLGGLSYSELIRLTSFLLPCLFICFLISKPLNALLLGEEYAKSLGLNIQKIRLLTMLLAGILAGAITAYCGPIGFIGIVIPHLSRLLMKTSKHQILIPSAILLGACTLLISDILANSPSNGISLPINSVTSILGIPFIIWMLLKRKNISSGF